MERAEDVAEYAGDRGRPDDSATERDGAGPGGAVAAALRLGEGAACRAAGRILSGADRRAGRPRLCTATRVAAFARHRLRAREADTERDGAGPRGAVAALRPGDDAARRAAGRISSGAGRRAGQRPLAAATRVGDYERCCGRPDDADAGGGDTFAGASYRAPKSARAPKAACDTE